MLQALRVLGGEHDFEVGAEAEDDAVGLAVVAGGCGYGGGGFAHYHKMFA